jgi:N-dimethylarginine dimethylaminohydrolase
MTTFADSGTETCRQATERKATVRHYVMTPPRFFSVDYVINPWMDATTPVDARVALAQWRQLHDVYVELGHSVDLVEPVPGLPDMVYAANGGLIIDGTAAVARFKYAERKPESVAYRAWLESQGYQPRQTRHVNEGQGDLLPVGKDWRDTVFEPTCGRTAKSPVSSTGGSSASNWSTPASTISIPR